MKASGSETSSRTTPRRTAGAGSTGTRLAGTGLAGAVAAALLASVPAPAADAAAVSRVARVSVTSAEEERVGDSRAPDLSADGRWVAFVSAAALVPEDTNGLDDVYLRDRTAGTTQLVSRSATLSDGASTAPTVSDDGRRVAFLSSATTLVAGDTNGVVDVFVKDVVSGSVVRASRTGSGGQLPGRTTAAELSGNGRYVAYTSAGVVRRFDRSTGAVAPVGGAGGHPDISADGRFVLFGLEPYDEEPDLLLRDMATGTTRDLLAELARPRYAWDDYWDVPHLSASGRHVVFGTDAWGLVRGDATEDDDLFVVDTRADSLRLVTEPGTVELTPGVPTVLAVSDDASTLVFQRPAAGGERQVLHTLQRSTLLVSRVASNPWLGTGEESDAGTAALDATGRLVAVSTDEALVPDDANGTSDVYTARPVRCSVTGTAGDDVLTGTGGRDVLCGLGGDDVLQGLAAADVLAGGRGTDSVSYRASAGGVDVRLGEHRATGAGADELWGFEAVVGSGSDDVLAGPFGVPTTVRGLGGDDELLGGGNEGDALYGGAGDDDLDGGFVSGDGPFCDGGSGKDTAVGCGTVVGVP